MNWIFDIPAFDGGDCLARYYVRLNEMSKASASSNRRWTSSDRDRFTRLNRKKYSRAKERIYTKMEELIHDFMLINFGTEPPVGEVYHAVEGSQR